MRSPVALLAAILVLPAFAEDADDDAEEYIEEIIVTSTYRDTRLMDTPLAISAVTSEDIMLKGIEDIQTLYQSIPGLSYRTNSQTYNTLSIRGLTPPTGGGSSVVGVYMDNLPITDANSGGLSQTLGALFDMERVEVLKGPQGTLYGEGNMGGSIRYISNKPDTSGLDYHVQTSLENMKRAADLTYRIDAMVNIPLADQLALRLVGYRRDRAGLLDQVAPRNKKDTDTFEEDGVRAAFTWYALETFEVTAMFNVVDGEYGGPGLGFHCFTESTPSDPAGQVPVYDLPGTTCAGQTDQFDQGDPYVTHLAHETYQSGGADDQTNYNLNIEWQLPFADLLSSTSFFDRETIWSEETSPRFHSGIRGLVDGYCFFFLPPPTGLPTGLFVCGPNKLAASGGDGAFYRATERVVQEFRLISNTDSPLQWTLGAYFKDDDSQTTRHTDCANGGSPVYATLDTHCFIQYGFFPDVSIEDQATIVLWLNALIPGNTSYRTFKEQSVYGEASYRLSDQWEILLGLRVAEVEYQLDVARPGVDSKVDPANSLGITSDIVSPKVTLTWRPIKDWMLYATYSQGFRPGIVNTGLAVKVAELNVARNNPDLTAADRAIVEGHYQRVFGNQTSDGDFVVNYELGVKATVLDGRMSFVGSLYRLEWEDTLIAVTDSISETIPGVSSLPFGYTINGGNAESEGLELEVRFAVTDDLYLTFGGDSNWTAKIGSAGVAQYGGVAIEPGNRLANSPKYSGYASLSYDFELFGMNAIARADTYVVAKSWNTANNERPAPSYQTTDLKLLVNLDNWLLSAYVRNVADEVVVYEFNQVGFRFGRPRTIGVQVNYRM